MYFRQLLRTRFVGVGAARLNRLHLVCRAEVAALKTFTFALITINVLFSVTAAAKTHLDKSCPSGGSGKSAVPHRQEVCFIVALVWCVCYASVLAAAISLKL